MAKCLNIVKWGNGHGVRLSRDLLSELDAKAGDLFDVEVSPGTLVLRVVEQDRNSAPADGADAPPLDLNAVQRRLQHIVDEADGLAALLDRRLV
jgi:antitoxin component of MazEF toxin-antitoxin module